MSRKAGSISEETRSHLLQAATEEFSEYGYDRSSLRRICAKADVTTGALYFFFQGKEDLFAGVIAPFTEGLLKMMESHYRTELESRPEEVIGGEEEDIRASLAILDFYYANRTVADIILAHRSLPVITAFFDRLIETMDRQTVHLLKLLGSNGTLADNPYAIHWISHLQMDAVLNVISHGFEPRDAKEQLKIAIRFLRSGFLALVETEGAF